MQFPSGFHRGWEETGSCLAAFSLLCKGRSKVLSLICADNFYEPKFAYFLYSLYLCRLL